MPEHLRALVVIVVIASIVFALAKVPLCAEAVAFEDFKRRRNLWFAVTLIAFFAHNFWLMCLLAGLVVVLAAQRDSNPVALYLSLLFVVPPFNAQIPGIGPINFFFDLNYIRLLNLCVLLPAVLKFVMKGRAAPAGSQAADYFLVGHIGLIFVMTMLVSNFTVTARQGLLLLLDIGLPYYAASRLLASRSAFREAAAAFLLSALLLASVAVFESVWGWLLYSRLDDVLGVRWAMGNYLMRGEGGSLRALASTGHSIVLGYLLMIALAMVVYVNQLIKTRAAVYAAATVLVAALVASMSRGPWVGTVAMLAVVLGIGPGAGRRLAWLAATCALVLVLISLSPWGAKVVDHIPFLGSIDSENVSYRQQLFRVSMILVWQSPIFGSYDYMYNPLMDQMRQGEGIVDMVNTYLGVALASGFVGLGLFVGPFIAAVVAASRVRRAVRNDPEVDALGRVLVGSVAGVAVTIATVSPINAVPTVYWLIAGLCIAYAKVFASGPVVSPSEARLSKRNAQVVWRHPSN